MLQNIPANATAVGVPAEIVRVGNIRCCPADDLDQQALPDLPQQRLNELEARLSRIEAAMQGEYPPGTAQNPLDFVPEKHGEKSETEMREALPLAAWRMGGGPALYRVQS